jgi:hypothetical protein
MFTNVSSSGFIVKKIVFLNDIREQIPASVASPYEVNATLSPWVDLWGHRACFVYGNVLEKVRIGC